MRLMSFIEGARAGFGIVKGDGVIDLAARYPRAAGLRDMLAPAMLQPLRELAERTPADHPLDAVTFLPVIPAPDKIIGVGVNYRDHREETGRSASRYPVLFLRLASSQVGHGQPLVKPRVSEQFDYEGELAVIIGTGGRHIAEADAMAHVAGYACYHDGSVRDWQNHTSQFTAGKNFPRTGGFGPWLTTADEIPNVGALVLTTRLNGREMQHATVDQMIFAIPALIAYISMFTELAAGDVIATGTPGGVGMKRTPPVFLQPGDVAEIEISGLGVLRNGVVAEAG